MVQPPPAVAAPRFRPSSQADLAQSGERTRIRNNLAVLRTLRTLDEEQRPATADEQTVLARWSGWGAVPKVFDDRLADLAAERAELLELLTPEEYQAAKTSTLTAYYTDADLVQGIWTGLRDLGFEGGNVLEPGCGSGNFVGFAPTDTSTPTRMIGVEVDPTSAAVARHLYPDAQVLAESFAETIAPEGAFDSVIGNVPFDHHRLYDPRYNPSGESIHNHFIAKSLKMTKPGGVVAVITSRFTLDAETAEFRNRLASMADLVGAVRLPINAHAAAAGTRTVTDVLFLRRREENRPPDLTEWNELAELPGPDGLQVNRYFLNHPEYVVGQLGTRAGRHGPEVTVSAPEGSMAEHFDQAVRSITQRAHERGLTIPLPGTDWEPLELVGGRDASRDGLMEVDDNDRLTRIVDGVRVEIDPPVKKSAQELFSLLRIRDAYLELVEAERTREVGDAHIEVLRAHLNERYDAYTGRYGPINRFGYKSNGQRNPPRLGGLREDLMAARVLALEKFDPTTQKATKVEIFRKRTIAPATPPERVETAADALAISLDTYAEVRLAEIQRLMGGISAEQARRELGTLVYTEPVTEDLVPAAMYLAGDVRAKLRAAEAAARSDERFAPNVEALREVVPVDLTPAEIEARLGATWIAAEVVEQFARHLLRDDRVRVQNPGGSLWSVSGGNPTSVLASNTWGTEKMPAQVILQNLLQNKAVKVTRVEVDSEGRERSTLDHAATEVAQAKAEEMTEEFATWAWADPDRARDLARIYNDRFNSLALCTYTGDHLTFPGLAQEFKPYPHQRAAIARALNEQSSLLAHGVGAGKTAEMVISIMEMRRLGQARKPAMVVPNHMLEQISREFAQLYPQAKILVADKDMMSRDYRQRFVDLAASGDWDVIVFGHNQFKNLPLPNAERRAYEDRQVAEFEEWITSAEDDPDVSPRTVKQLERAKVQLQNRYKKLWANVDAGSATLADCGIDAIVYDEAHEAKNAMVRSNIQDAAKADPSWQAEDLMMKADYIRRQGGKLIFATATPIANSVSEAYVVMRFLRPDLLHAAGIYDFDQWASTFGEIITEFEMKPEGGGFQQKDRFARFMNVPELLRAFHTFADVKLSSELGLNLPDLVRPGEGDETRPWVEGRQTVVVPPSRELLEYMEELGERADDIRRGKPQDRWSDTQQRDRPDNMLWVSSDGRSAATDLRLVGQQAAEQTKMAHVADQVAQIWAQHKDDVYTDPDTDEPEERTGSLQMVFCDLGTPSKDPTKYDAYADLCERLVAQGVPREQIRFVHEAKNDKEKADIFASARDGRTQIIVGSTKKMGTGTNMQRRAVALHHVDCPWRPVDIEQREGRLVRQGNANTRVRILSYVTEGSFDSYMWQTALRKLRFIEQIMRGTLDVREVEDVSSTAMSYAEVQALASGNPLMLEKVVVEKRVKKLERAFRNHHQGQAMLERTIVAGQREIANATAAVQVFDRALERRVPTKGEAFRMTVNGESYDKRTDAADALRTRIGGHLRDVGTGRARTDTRFDVGMLGGFNVSVLAYYGLAGRQSIEVYLDCPSNHTGRYGVESTLALTLTKDELATSTGHGLVMSLENTLTRMETQRAETIEAIPRLEAEIAHARESLGTPFSRQEELEETLQEEAALLSALSLPARQSNVLLEGRGERTNDLDSAVQDAAAAEALRTAAAPRQQGSPASAEQPQEPETVAPTPPPETEISSTWREQPTAEEVLSSAEQARETTTQASTGPSADREAPTLPEPTPTPGSTSEQVALPQEPVTAEPAAESPVLSTFAPEAPAPAVSPPEPVTDQTQETAVQPTESDAPAEPPVDTEELQEQAGMAVGLLMVEDHQRAETSEELRAQLNDALEKLLERGEFTSVSDLVRRANRVDPDYVLSRESYRSSADIEHPDARRIMASVLPVRIEDDFAPGGTGVIRHITGARHIVLQEVLTEHGFDIVLEDDEALLLNGDPDQRRVAWSAVLAEMERIERLAGSSYERVMEQQWQEMIRRGHLPREVTVEAAPEMIVEEPPQIEPEAGLHPQGPETTESASTEAGPEQTPQEHEAPAALSEQQQEAPEIEEPTPEPEATIKPPAPATQASTGPSADREPPRPAPGEEDQDLPPAPPDPIQASDGPDRHARAALRRLRSGFDPRTAHRDRATVQEGIDYLVDADMAAAALDLIHEANIADPSHAWSREPLRGQLMWDGPEVQEHVLEGPVIRIDHDGEHNTVVRGTSKDDEQVKRLLKELKFTWSRRQGFWYLQRRLNAPEQARRVSRLLAGLQDLGRDRITETQWVDIQRHVLDRRREHSQEVIDTLRKGVETSTQIAQQEGRYREAIITIDGIHRGLIEQGHVRLGDAPGTGDPMPFAELRTQLVTEGRELSRQLLDRFNAILKSPEPDLTAAWTLYEELGVIAPPVDITDGQLERTRQVLTHRFERASLTLPQEQEETVTDPQEAQGTPEPSPEEEPVREDMEGIEAERSEEEQDVETAQDTEADVKSEPLTSEPEPEQEPESSEMSKPAITPPSTLVHEEETTSPTQQEAPPTPSTPAPQDVDTLGPKAPSSPTHQVDDGYAEAEAKAREEQLTVSHLDAQVENGEREHAEVYTPEGTIRNEVLDQVMGDDPGPDPYDDEPDDLYEEGPSDPYNGPAPVPLRSSIDISGAESYGSQAAAERATWWIAQNGLPRWEQTTTAAELAALRSLPDDDLIALDHALHQVREHPLAGGPGAAAHRYADLSGAAAMVSERLDTDRLHLAQAATLAAEHAARLHATREYNLARMHGATPSQLARVEARQEAVRYTSADDARQMSHAVATVVGRWAQTQTSRQMRDSQAQGLDVARVRQVWEQVSDDGIAGGPGPAAARFDGFARAVGELNLRLEAESAQLEQVAGFAHRHASRLAATQQRINASRGRAQPHRAPETERPIHRRHGPGQDQGRER